MLCESSDREGAHKNSGSICDKITPPHLLGQFNTEEEEEEKEIQKLSYWTFGTVGGTFNML